MNLPPPMKPVYLCKQGFSVYALQMPQASTSHFYFYFLNFHFHVSGPHDLLYNTNCYLKKHES